MDVRIDLTDRHGKHPDSVRDHAMEKVGKLTHFFDKVHHIEVILDKDGSDHAVEVSVHANQHLHFVGHASHASAMAAIDRVVDKLERQVIRAKERMKDHRRGEAAKKPS